MKPWMIVLAILYTFGCITLGAAITGFFKWLAVMVDDSIVGYLRSKNQALKAKLYDVIERESREQDDWR
jgi:hypothetical protein